MSGEFEFSWKPGHHWPNATCLRLLLIKGPPQTLSLPTKSEIPEKPGSSPGSVLKIILSLHNSSGSNTHLFPQISSFSKLLLSMALVCPQIQLQPLIFHSLFMYPASILMYRLQIAFIFLHSISRKDSF